MQDSKLRARLALVFLHPPYAVFIEQATVVHVALEQAPAGGAAVAASASATPAKSKPATARKSTN